MPATCSTRAMTASARSFALVDRGADEDGEDDDLQDLVVRHRLHDRARHEMGDEIGERHAARRLAPAAVRQVHADAGLEQVDHRKTQRQRHDRGEQEPGERLGADAADLGRASHMGDARDQGREHERRDDHLDQAQEDGGDEAQDIRRDAKLRGREPGMAAQPEGDAAHHARDQPEREFAVHPAPDIACARFCRGEIKSCAPF